MSEFLGRGKSRPRESLITTTILGLRTFVRKYIRSTSIQELTQPGSNSGSAGIWLDTNI